MNKWFLLKLNKYFKQREHPFNMGEAKLNYANFEYESASGVFKDFENVFKQSIDEIVKGKAVLDLGSGAGGKSVYLYERGASMVFGIDLSDVLIDQGKKYIENKGYTDNVVLKVGDVTDIPFKNDSFDLVIGNDLMEHVQNPERMMREALRVLKPGGLFLVNFEPYFHFLGHHMWDVINIPWAHVLFSEQTRIEGYKELIKNLPDCKERESFRISKKDNGEEYIGYLNHMTYSRFKKQVLKESTFLIKKHRILPIDKFPFKFLYKIPLIQEFCILKLIYILEK